MGQKIKIDPVKGYMVMVPHAGGTKKPAVRSHPYPPGEIIIFDNANAAKQWRNNFAPGGCVVWFETGDEAEVVPEQ